MSIAFLSSFIVIIVIVVLIFFMVLIYPKKYKENVNNALHTGVPVKAIEPTVLFGAISLITLMVLNIVLLVSINNMQDNMNQLQNQVNEISSRVSYIRSDVSSTNNLINDLYQDSKWIKRSEYSIKSISNDGTAEVQIIFEMNRIPSIGSITLVYKDESDVVLTKEMISETTFFAALITVNIEDTYELSVMIDDGTTIENEDLLTLDIEDDINSNRNIDFVYDEEVEGLMKFIVRNDYSLYADLAFETVLVNIYLNDVVQYTETVTIPTFSFDETEIFEIPLYPYSYGEGEIMVSILCTDMMGNEYEMFGEVWEVDEVIFYEFIE